MIDRFPRETFKKKYIEKYGINGWIKYVGYYLEFPNGDTLKDVVDFLIYLRNIGFNSYYTTFNGCDLFVRDVSLENAMMELHNLDKQGLISFLESKKKTLEEVSQDKDHKLIKKM